MPFTVTSGGAVGAPTITGFTPTIGTPGTTVTITGTNFEPITASNKVRFHQTLGGVSSSTTTTLTASVSPGTTSGRIAVATPAGEAVSSGDFFVPFPPYTAADVESTGRLVSGGSQTVTISMVNKIALLVFDGTAGQRVSLHVTNSTLSDCLGGSILRLHNPDGALLTTFAAVCTGSLLEPPVLPVTGTYTIVLDPRAASTGQVTLTLYDVVDLSGTITPGGPAVTANLTTPGQVARWTFSGNATQKVSVLVNTSTIGNCVNGVVKILKPDGSSLGSTGACSGNFLGPLTLPVTGTYTLELNPYTANTGQATLTLYEVVDVSGTLTVGGPAVAVTLPTPGQMAQLTFSGSANQQVTVQVTSNTMGSVTVKLLKPDGTTLTSKTSSAASFNLTTQTLPTTGTYTVLVDPSSANTGSLNVNVTSP
jgi:hypothetical protein